MPLPNSVGKPFAATSSVRTAARVLSLQVPDPRSIRPDCPRLLAELLLTALARDERARPATAPALREAFEAVGRALPAAAADAVRPGARSAARPHVAPTAGT